ncbi:hypothetical protein [Metamycoplasma hominis]|nr:hypothetical protein [Metamycoplasma hominis]
MNSWHKLLLEIISLLLAKLLAIIPTICFLVFQMSFVSAFIFDNPHHIW